MQDVILIDVPEGASNIYIEHIKHDPDYVRLTYTHSGEEWEEDLPNTPGSWTIVEQTEEGAAKIMDIIDFKTVSGKPLYYNYESNDRDFRGIVESAFDTALVSLHSWIRSQGKEPKTSIILKKEI
jgi:hypothetical protein